MIREISVPTVARFLGGHLQTILARMFSKAPQLDYQRHRLVLTDGDWLDLDFLGQGSDKALIACHGLEGSSNSPYIRSLVDRFSGRGFDSWAVNFRGCSGERNCRISSYNSGSSGDLFEVINFILSKGYQEIYLVGFSLGGNVVLKYLGESGEFLPAQIKMAAAVSVPCDLVGAARKLDGPRCKIYRRRFMKTLIAKSLKKIEQHTAELCPEYLDGVSTFAEFDTKIVAALHGYRGAEDYWQRASSLRRLKNINIPTLILNALNDPFLSESCSPRELCSNHPDLHLHLARSGGHVGFDLLNKNWIGNYLYQFFQPAQELNRVTFSDHAPASAPAGL